MNNESALWTGARDILHFVGVCGAGKTTLSQRLAARCRSYGGKAIGTIDWDSHTNDIDRQAERAFNREFDRISNEGSDPAIQNKIVQGSLDLIETWNRSAANLVLVDRWYESYDSFPLECAHEIESALSESGFRITLVNLVIAIPKADGSEFDAMCARLAHTRAKRPESWWAQGMGTLEEMAMSECAYQTSFQDFCNRSPFSGIRMSTTDMDWESHEQFIVDSMVHERRWRDISTYDANAVLSSVLR